MSTYGQDPNAAYASPSPAGDSLALPLYGATIGQAASRFFRKYATFSGRASRSEYWWWFLIALAINVVIKIIDSAATGGWMAAAQSYGSIGDIIGYLWGLATLIPGLALTFRRLHDTNRSGFFILLALIPIVGVIILLVFLAGAEKPEGARFD